MSPFEEYLATITPAQKAHFERMREVLRQLVPDAEEGVSYGMPAFLYKGKGVMSIMVTKKFLSLYPFSGKVVDKLHDRLKEFETTPGSIHFSLEHPIPEPLLKEIISARLQELEK